MYVDHGFSTFPYFSVVSQEKTTKITPETLWQVYSRGVTFPYDSIISFAVRIHEFVAYLVYFSCKCGQIHYNRYAIVSSIPVLPEYWILIAALSLFWHTLRCRLRFSWPWIVGPGHQRAGTGWSNLCAGGWSPVSMVAAAQTRSRWSPAQRDTHNV